MDHILIEGFIGCGKGAVGTKLSEEMKIPLIDTDSKVAERMKMTPEEIYDKFGEVYFRALETFILGKLVRMRKRSIIVLGSGLPTHPDNAPILKGLGRVYYLKAGEDSIKKNIEKNHEKAWLEDDDDLNEKVEELLAEREPYYLDVADVIIKTGRKNTATIATEILNDVVKWDQKRAKEKEKAKEEKARKEEKAKKEEKAVKEEKAGKGEKAGKEEKETVKKKPAAKKKAEKPEVPEEKTPAKKKTAAKKKAEKPEETEEKAPVKKKTAAKKNAEKPEVTEEKAPAKKKTAAKKKTEKTDVPEEKAPAKKKAAVKKKKKADDTDPKE